MVRINLINPRLLADQHLIAEYNETLMLLGYVRLHPKPVNIPPTYRLGKGHIIFFKDKLLYLAQRHNLLKAEMRKRKFATNITINLKEFPEGLHNDWAPTIDDVKIITLRIKQRLAQKPDYYLYYGEHKSLKFFHGLIDEALETNKK